MLKVDAQSRHVFIIPFSHDRFKSVKLLVCVQKEIIAPPEFIITISLSKSRFDIVFATQENLLFISKALLAHTLSISIFALRKFALKA